MDETSNYIVSIIPTGKSQNGYIEFEFSNTIADTVWYLGYDKNSPLYLTQIISDTGWVFYGGWCGTGTILVPLAPFESICLSIIEPSSDNIWRVGLYTQRKSYPDGDYSWSNAQY